MTYVACRAAHEVPLPSIAARMIELFDGTRTVEQVCEEVQISVTRGDAVVRKLNAQGLVCPFSELERADTLRNIPPLSDGFSVEEEAFFASEVLPIDECDEPFPTLRERFSLALAGLLRCRGVPA